LALTGDFVVVFSCRFLLTKCLWWKCVGRFNFILIKKKGEWDFIIHKEEESPKGNWCSCLGPKGEGIHAFRPFLASHQTV
jgi:hypothetical protein